MFEYHQPDVKGHFGPYGGSFISETLTHAIQELKDAYARYQHDPAFLAEFHYELKHFVGRPSPIYHAARTSREMGGAQIFLKREDLNHTGAHKINNVIGQAMLAKRMGKPRVIAETGAGQHGVATATICARYGLECVVYMGAEDVKRQSPNVYRMKLLGATVVPVESGSRTLKDACNEAIRDWVTNVRTTHYILGSVVGPHPYPLLVREFQSVIGRETGTHKWLVWSHAWAHPSVLERRKSEAARFHDFARDGDLTLCARIGDDIDDVVSIVQRVDAAGLLDKVGVDPAGIGGILDALAGAGLAQDKVLGISQGWRLGGAIKTTERKLVEGQLLHGGSAMMNWCVGNARVEPKGNSILITKQASGFAKIDPLMALFNASALLVLNPMAQQRQECRLFFA